MFPSRLFSDASEKEILGDAKEFESKTIDFYKSLENKFSQLWKQMEIHQIVKEEKEHAESLESMIAALE